MRLGITALLFVVGFFASMTTNVTPAQALTCEQVCNSRFQTCLVSPGGTKAICLAERGECLAECP